MANPDEKPAQHALMQRVLAERPEIAARAGFFRVCAIREWIYANTVVTAPSLLLDREQDTIYERSGGDILDLMRQGAGGFFCGGAARFASKVYAAFGFRAFDINIGLAGTPTTHVVNVVRCLSENGVPIYSVQDSYLDYALIDAAGRPLDFPSVVELLSLGRHDRVVVSGGGGGLRPVLVPSRARLSGDDHPFFAAAAASARRSRSLQDGSVLHWTPIMRPRLFERAPFYAAQYQEPLRARFGSVSILNLLRLPLSTSGDKEIEDLVSGIKAGGA